MGKRDEQLVRSASDPAQVKAAEKTIALRAEKEDGDLLALMRSLEGRRLIWRLLVKTHVYESIFVTSSEIYYKAGQQDVGHWLQREVGRVAPAEYILMQKEAAALEVQDAIIMTPNTEEQ